MDVETEGGREMKKMMGVNTPVVTPMHPDQSVDYAGLERLCGFLIEKGVHGLYPNGSAGEMGLLTADERKKVLERCVKAAAGRVSVYAMVGAITTAETIELARHAEACGADGVGVVTPWYFRLDADELAAHFLAVAKSVSPDFPVYLYGIPQYAVNDITPALASRVADGAENVVGIKYSYPDLKRMIQFMDLRGGRFSLIAGADELFYPALACGGEGTISGNSNLIPEHFVAIYGAFLAGNHELAKALQRKTNLLCERISGCNNIARYKDGLVRRGVIDCAAVRGPLRMLTDDERAKFHADLDRLAYLDSTSLYTNPKYYFV
jgi:4-hydroxy-tetrahydrodipicolinate synthase